MKIENFTKQGIDTDIRYTSYNPDGSVYKEGECKNFITQRGRDELATITVADAFIRLSIGSGTQTYKRDGINVSQSGTSVTSTSSFFTADDATNRRFIKFADNTKARIVAYVSAIEVTVDRSQTVTQQNASIFYDELNDLNVFEELVAPYSSGDNGAEVVDSLDYSVATTRRWRTFRTSTYPSGLTITELGVTNETTGPNPELNTLAILNTPIEIVAGGFVDIRYEIITTADAEINAVIAPITGIASNTSECVFANDVFISLQTSTSASHAILNSDVSSSGSSQSPSNTDPKWGWFTEPMHAGVGTGLIGYVSEDSSTPIKSDPPSADNSDTSTNLEQAVTPDTYSSGSYSATIRATLAGFGSSSWYSYGVRNGTTGAGLLKRCLFDSVQNFGALNTLELVFTKSWEV